MSTKLHIKKGDTVFVNTGEDKGKTGRVLEVKPAEQRAIVEGVDKQAPAFCKTPQACIKMEAAILANLQVVDPLKVALHA